MQAQLQPGELHNVKGMYSENDERMKTSLYLTKAASGEYVRLTQEQRMFGSFPIPIAFPGIVALSHMWLDPSHCDPEAKVRPHHRLAL